MRRSKIEDEKWSVPEAPNVVAGSNAILSSAAWDDLVTLNAWHKVKITLSTAGLVTCWIDGQQAGSGSAANMNYKRVTPWALTLGNFDGDIDEVRVRDVVR